MVKSDSVTWKNLDIYIQSVTLIMGWKGVKWGGMEWNRIEWTGLEYNGMEWIEVTCGGMV